VVVVNKCHVAYIKYQANPAFKGALAIIVPLSDPCSTMISKAAVQDKHEKAKKSPQLSLTDGAPSSFFHSRFVCFKQRQKIWQSFFACFKLKHAILRCLAEVNVFDPRACQLSMVAMDPNRLLHITVPVTAESTNGTEVGMVYISFRWPLYLVDEFLATYCTIPHVA
jgi:hypothetical protein